MCLKRNNIIMNCSTKYKQSAPFPFKQLFKDLMLQTSSISATFHHTSYLSFLLHWPHFRKPNFTPKKTTKGTKNTKNVSEKVKYMHFFHSIWKTLHLTENFYTDMSVVSVTNMRYDVNVHLYIFNNKMKFIYQKGFS